MHPLTVCFNYGKARNLPLVLARKHIGFRELTDWYPDWIYEVMETDEARNRAYREAIREIVAGKVVLELGTGRKALWAACCAAAGARKVYAIEANEKACRSSAAALAAQGVANVELIQGFSDQVTLPERCDVLVHDLIGDIGSSEGMIPFIEDAKRRLLKPGAAHIPHRCTTGAVLAADPRLEPGGRALSFALRGFRRFEPLRFTRYFGFPPSSALSSPVVLEDFQFAETPATHTRQTLPMEVVRGGRLRGVLFFIRLHLGQQGVIDTWTTQTSWSTPYVRMPAAAAVRPGDVVGLEFESDLSGNPRYSLRLNLQDGGATRELGRYSWSGD